MELDLSVSTPTGLRDLAVTAPASAPVPDVAAALAAAAGVDARLWIGRSPLADGALRGAGLHPGAVLAGTADAGRTEPAGVLALEVVAGPGAGRRVPLGRGRIVVGRDAGCDVVIEDPDVSRRHAELGVGVEVTVRDLGSTNGTTVDDESVGADPVPVPVGARLRLGDCLLAVTRSAEPPAEVVPGANGTRRVLRPPRTRPTRVAAEIVLPVRQGPVRPGRVQWLSALLPAGAGVALALWARSPQFLLFALLSPLMMISTALGDRVHWRRSRRRAAVDHRRALADARQEAATGLTAETRDRWAAAPDPATAFRTATVPGRGLWARRPGDDDGLHVRLGIGDVPSRLLVREGTETRPAGTLASVPVEVDLRRGALGLAGPGGIVDAVAAWVVGQLAVHHSPAEVELAFLLDGQRAAAWSWARWLPHVGGRVAIESDERAELLAALTALMAARRSSGGTGPSERWVVLVVDRAAEFAELPALAGILATGPDVGVTAVCIETGAGRWPGGCRSLAWVHGETGTRLAVRPAPDAPEIDAIADQVSPEWADRVARQLASCVDDSAPGGGLPDRVGLLEVLELRPDADAVATRWARSGGGARAVLGLGIDGGVTVDLAEAGPHALIAGTTGSGKSELLQALVASLAVNHPPDELTFLLVDYKGGAAFADCGALPHVTGVVTDLDPYLTERALRSLDAELRRRERALAVAGASDLDGYRRRSAPGEPLARLVIVVDEFAALAAELPEFVRGLVSVAQRGRSLGVHLVLATQRPGSAVSPEIRANTALRFCLRVTDPAESSDVIGSPAAAALDRATPGRAWLRVGGSLTAFQSAFPSGRSPDPAAITVEPLGPWRRRLPAARAGGGSDLARLVDAVGAAARRLDRPPAPPPWTPPLPDLLPVAELEPAAHPGAIRIGRIDRPALQRWDDLDLDLGAGESLLVSGAGRSGRTRALATVALAAADRDPPGQLALYVVDPAGALAGFVAPLPHVASSLGADGIGLVPRLLTRLERACAPSAPGASRRAVLLVDGWDRVVAALADTEGAACVDLLGQLLRIGPGAGLTVVVSGDRSLLAPRIASGFARRILLRQGDRSDFGLAGIPARAVPPDLGPGRGLLADDGALVQVATEPGPDEALRSAAMAIAHRRPRDIDAIEHGPIRLRPLPASLYLSDLPLGLDGLAVGLAGDECEPLALDPFAGAGRLLVAGPPRSGRTTLLRSWAEQAAAAGMPTVVAAPARSALAAVADRCGLPVVRPDADPGPPPPQRTLLLVDDCEAFDDQPAGERLTDWLRDADAPLAAVVAGRADDLTTTYRGLGAAARRSHCGLLLRPGPIDGELLGVRLPRRDRSGPPGRGVLVGDPAWGPLFAAGEPVPVQVAAP